jgi:hypothetical protein
VGAPLPSRALQAGGAAELRRRERPPQGYGARPRPPAPGGAGPRLAPGAYASLRGRWEALFRHRWPHLVWGPVTALAVGGRPRGFWLLAVCGQARGSGWRAGADERWLLLAPLGWLDPAA